VRFVDEYRDSDAARRLVDLLVRRVTRPWTVMEVCGGQTHTIVKYGVDQLVPSGVELVHGPGCPVCVTPLEMVDRALAIAADPRVIFCSFGDMLRVPGSSKDLLSVKAEGGDVRIVYSPMDCLRIARENPGKEIVFFAVGFETTAPANAMVARQAKRLGVTNLSLLVSHVLVPPAMDLILASPDNRVQGFLAAGHVCTVMGYAEYEPLARAHHVPIVVTGFEPLDVLQGLYMLLGLLEDGRVEVQNQYTRVVRREGNPSAKAMLSEVFEVTDRKWRGVGEIPRSGYRLRPEYAEFDAELRFDVGAIRVQESSLCRAGEVLRGLIKPNECEAFGVQCTPERPLGATMVSSEGACAAYYHYGRFREQVRTRT